MQLEQPLSKVSGNQTNTITKMNPHQAQKSVTICLNHQPAQNSQDKTSKYNTGLKITGHTQLADVTYFLQRDFFGAPARDQDFEEYDWSYYFEAKFDNDQKRWLRMTECSWPSQREMLLRDGMEVQVFVVAKRTKSLNLTRCCVQ